MNFHNLFAEDEEEDIVLPVRYYPESLSVLSKATKFTEIEVKRIYRGFKNECPNGVIEEDKFKNIYSQFFPLGGKALTCITSHCRNPYLSCHQAIPQLVGLL